MGQIASISPKGIIRNTPDSSCEDGSLLEAINVRFRDGAWRGVGEKQATGWYAESLFVFDSIAYHPILPVNTYIVHNADDNKVYTVLFTNGTDVQAVTQVIDLGSETFNRFSSIGNILLIFTNLNKHILYWDKISLSYKDLTFLPVPIVNIGEIAKEESIVISESQDFPDPIPSFGYATDNENIDEWYRTRIVGEYLKDRAEKQAANKIEGYVMVRLAYRLFDGSYILHTQPFLHHVGYNAIGAPAFVVGPDLPPMPTIVTLNDNYYAELAVYYNFFNSGSFTLPDHDALGVVESLDVFCSRPIDGFDYNQTYEKWGEVTSGVSYSAPFNSDYIKKIMDQPLYKVHSIPIKDIILQVEHYDSSGIYYSAKAGVVYPDMRKEVSTNELLPIDSFSHHKINSLSDYQYNSRIHLGDIFQYLSVGHNCIYHSMMLAAIGAGFNNGYDQSIDLLPDADTRAKFLGDYISEDGIGSSTFKVYQQVYINTEHGRKIVTSEVQSTWVESFDAHNIPDTFKYFSYFYTSGVTHSALIFNPIISYPDYRAYKVRYFYTTSGNRKFLADYALKSLPAQNIAYYLPELTISDGSTGMFYPVKCALPDSLGSGSAMPADDITVDDPILFDTNRMQVSEIFNPFIWPAINSYRFGLLHNEIIAISTVQSQMSDAAFGRYPLYVFTKSGVYAIEHGTGEVLYQSIQPLNNEILISRGSLCAISGSIVFACKEGIRVITGSDKPDEISIGVEGSINNPLALLPYYNDALSGLRLPQINNFRTNVTFLTYIQAAKIFYDVENKEIIVSNPDYDYSYSYSLFTQSWATRTDVFTDTLVISGRQIAVKTTSALVEEALVYTTSLHYLDKEDDSTGLCDYFLMQTRPLNFANSSNKHINKLISRCRVITKDQEYAIQLIAGSNDLITWQIVNYVQYSGDQTNMINTNTNGNFKYFIIAIAGERKGFYLNQIDIDWKERFNNKLR